MIHAQSGLSFEDPETQNSLQRSHSLDSVRAQKLPHIALVLVVLSAHGMVLDCQALKYQINLVYPEASVFFRANRGAPVGAPSPQKVDLLIDFTSPNDRESWLRGRKLAFMAKYAVGRDVGFWRKRKYQAVIKDSEWISLVHSLESLEREHFFQTKVLSLVGIHLVARGEPGLDRSKSFLTNSLSQSPSNDAS